jgi:hypothetical protein
MLINRQTGNYTNSTMPMKIKMFGFILSALAFSLTGCTMFSSSQPEIEMEEISFSFDSDSISSDHFDRYLKKGVSQ